jgi:hypothetical protein
MRVPYWRVDAGDAEGCAGVLDELSRLHAGPPVESR